MWNFERRKVDPTVGHRRGSNLLLRVLLVSALLPCSTARLRADEAEPFFDPSYVHEIHLIFEDTDWYNTLWSAYASGQDDFYLPCRWEAVHGADTLVLEEIGARFKGHSSFWDSGEKKSIKIDFNEFDPDLRFLGLKKLNLNNNFRDPTMIRETLFLDFLSRRATGHRAAFARLVVNGEPWGLFTMAEQIDGTFTDRLFGDDEDGNLYKGEFDADMAYRGEDPADYQTSYEKKTNEDADDWTDLVSFLALLNQTGDTELPELLPTILDYESLVQHFATNILLINLDAYIGPAHNYYLYHRDHDDRFAHLIWDCNMAFGNYTTPFPEGYEMVEVPLLWRSTSGAGRPLADRLWDSPVLVRDHYRALAAMLRADFGPEVMDPRIDEMADVIRADVYADPKKEFTNEEFELNLSQDVGRAVGLKRFVADRSEFVRARLDELAEPSDYRLNELMAINQQSITDEAGDHDPWIEIYNLGPGTVSTASLFLTDDESQPLQWPLPTESIGDGGFSVYWLDGEPGEGSGHAPFTLAPTGGEIFLHLQDGAEISLVDSVAYPSLGADCAWGRWPDGTGTWRQVPYPTAGSENPSPATLPLSINEFVASNDSGLTDEAGEYDDWLEIHNAGTDPIQLAGLFLTDSLSDRDQWVLPDVVVPPAGFVVIFCDSDEEQGDLHAGFKLARSGGEIGLFDSDGLTAIDTVTYSVQETDVAFGRCPDGAAELQSLGEGTPGSSNNTACPDGMNLAMDDVDLALGDPFLLQFTLGPQSETVGMDAYVLLGVGTTYWCWPSWRPLEEGLDHGAYSLPSGSILSEDVLDFVWPEVEGSADGLYFYGAAFSAGSFDLIGDLQIIEFGYR